MDTGYKLRRRLQVDSCHLKSIQLNSISIQLRGGHAGHVQIFESLLDVADAAAIDTET